MNLTKSTHTHTHTQKTTLSIGTSEKIKFKNWRELTSQTMTDSLSVCVGTLENRNKRVDDGAQGRQQGDDV
jgi:hypothetical protein